MNKGYFTFRRTANSMGVSERQFFRILDKFRRLGRKIESLGVQSHPLWNRTEKIFPLHLPTILKIEVVRKGKARRAKLYYLREATGRKAKIKRRK